MANYPRRRNPFERIVPDPLDLAADPHPLAGGYPLPQPVRPGDFQDPNLPAQFRDQILSGLGGGRLRGRFMAIPFTIGVQPFVIVPSQPSRYYFFIVNNSAANRIFVGFDIDPNANNGVVLEANLGFYEPWIVPTNEIRVAAAAAATSGLCIVATADTQQT